MTETITHRTYVMQAFDTFLKNNNITGGTLLDVGCRDECLKKEMETRGFVWTGIDTHPEKDTILFGRMEDMKELENDSYDIVFCCHAFEHCENPISALREMWRVTKKWIFLATPCPCEQQILKGDKDHIFVLHPTQLVKIVGYCKPFGENCRVGCYLQKEGIDLERDWNVILEASKNGSSC